jgi:hypothetical protein
VQEFKSSYGRKGCRVPDACPTRAIRHHLGRVSVGTSPADVAAEVRAEITLRVARHPEDAAAWSPTMRRAAVRYALWQHAENRAEYAAVMGGAEVDVIGSL